MAKASWDMTGMVVLVPWGDGHPDDQDDLRVVIQNLGGDIVYSKPPARGRGSSSGLGVSDATHELVLEGPQGHITQLPTLRAEECQARLDAAFADFAGALVDHQRPTYVPVVSPSGSTDKGSRYFGKPWMPDGMPWPKHDGEPLNFVLQLSARDLPCAIPGLERENELLLFFDGSHIDIEANLVVRVDATLPGSVRETHKGATENPTLGIGSWRESIDIPDNETIGTIDELSPYLPITELFGSDTIGQAMCADGVMRPEREVLESGLAVRGHTFECDKLGGWPRWEQGDETPEDSSGEPMVFVMQVGHEGLCLGEFDPEKIEWPTWGRGQIFHSPGTGEWKYVWACD